MAHLNACPLQLLNRNYFLSANTNYFGLFVVHLFFSDKFFLILT